MLVSAPAVARAYLAQKGLDDVIPPENIARPARREPSQWRQPFWLRTSDGEIVRGKFAHLLSGQHYRGLTTRDAYLAANKEFAELVMRFREGIPIDAPSRYDSIEAHRAREAFRRWADGGWIPAPKRDWDAIIARVS
jgi:hypothetical protein